MTSEQLIQPTPPRIIVVANEKGGSGKSTIAMHLAVALMKAGQAVATIDLDSRQKSFSRYIQNRRTWAAHAGLELEIPTHLSVAELGDHPSSEDEISARDAFVEKLDEAAKRYQAIIIDTPGHKSYLTSVVHSMADTLITPLNDSFIDFDVLGTIDPTTLQISGTSHYANIVENARRERDSSHQGGIDWIVMRNRLSVLASRNKRMVGEKLQELAQRLNFRLVEGLSERLIFREFYPRGLTALDNVNETTLGSRPTLSHVAARQEVQTLIQALGLSLGGEENGNRNAA